uniref:Glutathione S-transferase n=1 Tax=Tetraselmis sp. GSL018 TaxID=582737 RepID=A0A061S7B3_9CHLO
MVLATLAKIFGGSAAVFAAERFLSQGANLPSLTKLEVPGLYGAVILANAVGTGFVLFKLGMEVGKARKKYNVEYPKMYADGDSEEAKAFNNVQRGHQHALESYPQFLACSLIGGLTAPISVTAAGILWSIGRVKWASAYAEKGAGGRYSSSFSMFIWYSLLYVQTAAAGTAVALLRQSLA